MSSTGTPKKRVGRAFDVRTLIGALLGVYGVILTVMGLWFTSEAEMAKVDGENLNLWTGLGLLAAAALFGLWAWLRPLAVPATTPADEGDRPQH